MYSPEGWNRQADTTPWCPLRVQAMGWSSAAPSPTSIASRGLQSHRIQVLSAEAEHSSRLAGDGCQDTAVILSECPRSVRLHSRPDSS